MSKADILAALPTLSVQDRADILEKLWQLDEAASPSDRERSLLNEAQAAYDADPLAGAPWSAVEARLRRRP